MQKSYTDEDPIVSDILGDLSLQMAFERVSDGFAIEKDGNRVRVAYQDAAALRRALTLLRVHGDKARFSLHSARQSGMFGVMVDCSRNAVASVSALKSFVKTVSALGYNTLMLYTEDTFEVADEPFFGLFRGAYTQAELTEIVAFAKQYGVTAVPCIQTLAHLNQIFRWPTYHKVNDVGDILLAGDEATYALIDKMLAALRKVFNTDQINIGMDEAHRIGLGQYLAKNGFQDRTEIFLKHMHRVLALCKKHGFTKPMMWSDMFMRLAFGGNYYDIDTPMPEQIVNAVPPEAAIVYWDYYNDRQQTYDALFSRHKLIGKNVYFACGAWKWSGFAPFNRFSIRVNQTAFASAQKHGINDVLVTLWGDNGGEAGLFSVLPTLIDAANRYYGQDESYNDLFCQAIAGISFEDFLTIDAPNRLDADFNGVSNNSKVYLYNDILCGIFDSTVERGYGKIYAENATKLAAIPDSPFAYLFQTQESLCRVLAEKCELGVQIRESYQAKDKSALQVCADRIETVIMHIKTFYFRFKKQWQRENKPFGFEVQDYRLGGLLRRLRSAQETLQDYLDGKTDCIPELDAPCVPYIQTQDNRGSHLCHNDFLTTFSTNVP